MKWEHVTGTPRVGSVEIQYTIDVLCSQKVRVDERT